MTLVVVGLGNDLLGDDAVGLEAARAVRRELGGVGEVRESAQSGLYLLETLEGFDDAILLDSMVGKEPGRLREFAAEDLKPQRVASAHFAGLPEMLAIARRARVKMPKRIRIIAVEVPNVQRLGARPRARVRQSLPEIVRRVEETARSWGYRRPAGRPRRKAS